MTEPMTRLHISPFAPDLLPAILGSNLAESAQNISYHFLQSFPENSYGYLDLPNMDAEKVKKKLNGSILKGRKFKVEEARPMKRQYPDTEDAAAMGEASPRRSKRSKKEIDVLPAHEISPDRKVKRGWTEPKTDQSKKDKRKKDKKEKKEKPQVVSKYTEKEELLFKTKIPSNKKSTGSRSIKKEKKDKSGADVVHEFKHNSSVPSFLRDSKVSTNEPALEYQDREGWVDKDGKVVEEETGKASRKRKAANLGLEIDVNKAQTQSLKRIGSKPLSPPPSKPASSEIVPSVAESSDETEDESDSTPAVEETSSSGSSSESEESNHEAENIKGTPPPTIAITATTPVQEVHPLEALFKKPRLPISNHHQESGSSSSSQKKEVTRPMLEVDTTFSFFAQEASDEENDNEVNHNLPTMPMTPFSSQDFRSRTLRSAAPTPDTADPRRSKGYASFMLGEDNSDSSSPDISEDEKEDGENDTAAPTSTLPSKSTESHNSALQIPQSDFEKKFWEKRGENNRAWKARRRAVLKEKRQRDNRARRPKAW